MKKNLAFSILLLLLSSACSQSRTYPLELAAFTKNSVSVLVRLEKDNDARYFLSATFTPEQGLHLYSKDLPVTGVDGLGRPTLVEAGDKSQYSVKGDLIESVSAQIPEFEPKSLLVYPAGTVTLSLPIDLPPGKAWTVDTVKITYMACSDNGCKAPVIRQELAIRIPGKAASH